MQDRSSFFRSSTSVTVLGTMGIGLLWSPVLIAFFGVSDPVVQSASDGAAIEFLKSDGSLSEPEDTIAIERAVDPEAKQVSVDIESRPVLR